MAQKRELQFDEIGYWSEIKLDIIKKYAAAYTAILSTRTNPAFTFSYIDAFSGAGLHISKETGEFISGSPLNALQVQPPFNHYYLVDLDNAKIEHLKGLVGDHQNVELFTGDCNNLLLRDLFPKIDYKRYQRALCLLDPYGLHLQWEVIKTAAAANSIEIFLNFPVLDINRNALWRNPDAVPEKYRARMTAFWGDESWRSVAYSSHNLFGLPEKEDNDVVAEAVRQRLIQVAGFKHVPPPLPMRNSQGAIVYYLYFASPKPVAAKIVSDIFSTYSRRGVQ